MALAVPKASGLHCSDGLLSELLGFAVVLLNVDPVSINPSS